VKIQAITLIMLALMLPRAWPEDPPQSANYILSEWGYAHGEASRVLKKKGGSVVVMPEAVGMDLAGQTKSKDCILSANFLTNEFSLFLEAPSAFAVHSSNASQEERVLTWQLPSDWDLIDGYRVRVYDIPDRSGSPVFEDDGIGPSSTTCTYNMDQNGVLFADLASYNGTTESDRSDMIKLARTQNRTDGDANGDGLVDGDDFMDVLASYGTVPGAAGWNPAADAAAPYGVIDDADVAWVALQLGWRPAGP